MCSASQQWVITSPAAKGQAWMDLLQNRANILTFALIKINRNTGELCVATGSVKWVMNNW